MQKLKYLKDIEALCCLLRVAIESSRPELKDLFIETIPKNKNISDFAKHILLKHLNPNL